ncbi:hypothetical protein Tco_1563962 [Tanacetum coccineum]
MAPLVSTKFVLGLVACQVSYRVGPSSDLDTGSCTRAREVMIFCTIKSKPLALPWGRTPRLDSGVRITSEELFYLVIEMKLEVNGRDMVKEKWDAISDLEQSKPLYSKLKDLKSHLKLWMQELEDLEKLESMDIVQKSRVKWEVEGDEIQFFFMALLTLEENLKWSKESCLMVFGIPNLRTSNQLSLTSSRINFLESMVSMDEIKAAVWDCGSQKAPGPDGYSFMFIKKFWDLLKHDIQSFVVCFFSTGPKEEFEEDPEEELEAEAEEDAPPAATPPVGSLITLPPLSESSSDTEATAPVVASGALEMLPTGSTFEVKERMNEFDRDLGDEVQFSNLVENRVTKLEDKDQEKTEKDWVSNRFGRGAMDARPDDGVDGSAAFGEF